ERSAMSDAMRNSTGSIGTVSEMTKYAEEIEKLIGGHTSHIIISTDSAVVRIHLNLLCETLERLLSKELEANRAWQKL
ncbi:MAG: hypothetical protein IPO63_09205, partial [Bacteroidetes bacterium]|nr:hypothetical protein [Bacteroidota bacterium]